MHSENMGTMSALDVGRTVPESPKMAEIRVAPQRRSKAIVWIIVAVVVVAAVAWYFLAGPGATATTGV
jgi:hypothetical protein